MRPTRSDNLCHLFNQDTITSLWLPSSLNQTGCHQTELMVSGCQLNFDLRHSWSPILDVLSGSHSLFSYLLREQLRTTLLCSGAVLMLNQKVEWTKVVTLVKLTFYPWKVVLAIHQPRTQKVKVEDCEFKVTLFYEVRLLKAEDKTKQKENSSSSLPSEEISIFLRLHLFFIFWVLFQS